MKIEEINRLCKGTFIDLLKIEFTAASDGQVDAIMPITTDLYQPTGSVHGGALISLAETVGSAGSFLMVDPELFQVYGSVVNSQHILPARKGFLHASARIVLKADFKHVWDVEIKDDEGKLISISRVTNSVKPKPERQMPG